MLINDNEYNAPWNDQYYIVAYDHDGEFTVDTMILPGPRKYTHDELKRYAEIEFGRFPILYIKEYHEVYR